jgi:hypothetical protein
MRLFRSILSLTLAALVLLASSSFYVATHSCGGRINKIAFLEIADGCGHAKMPPCHQKIMKGCCENEVIAHDAQDIKSEAKVSLVPLALSFDSISTPVVLSEIIPSAELSSIKFFNYDSPLRSGDLVVTHRVFLI